MLGAGEQQDPLDDPFHAGELVERDVELGSLLAEAPFEQFQMATCDRHGRAELVRDVVQKPLVALEQVGALLGERLDRRQGLGAATRMPDHGEEHRRHQRHLEELAPELQSVERIGEDRGAGGDHDAPSTSAVTDGLHTLKP